MTARNPLYILGAGGHAGSVLDAALSAGFVVMGFIDADKSGERWGVPILENLATINLSSVSLALGVGTNFSRESSFDALRALHPAAQFPPIIHATAWVSPMATLDEGAVVLSMAHIGPGSRVERGALVNTGASLDHDSALAPFASLGPGARTGGSVTIGQRTMVGLGAGILQGVSVGSDTVIGAHSLVTESVSDLIVAIGVPAKTLTSRERDDPYY